ncbi:hypothetical protein [Cohaesibacter sp. ES.047]|nr:hypothetical protein [Cohaesibacter sp. ES.047]
MKWRALIQDKNFINPHFQEFLLRKDRKLIAKGEQKNELPGKIEANFNK